MSDRETVHVSAYDVEAEAYADWMDDYDLFEAVAENGPTSPAALLATARAMFGADQWAEITKKLREDGGRLPASKAWGFVNEAGEQLGGAGKD